MLITIKTKYQKCSIMDRFISKIFEEKIYKN